MRALFRLLILALLPAACEPPAQEVELERFLARRAAVLGDMQACERDSGTAQAELVSQARCMRFSVAENPAEPEGRRIDLQVMLIPSIRTRPEPDPLAILVGGPGQAATEAGVVIAQVLEQVRQERDILLVDQRGTGALSPLDCDFAEEETALETDLPFILERQTAVLRDCLASLEARPEFYTTDLAVQDLESIRRHFGYGPLNLWGGSYGTRVALAWLKAYPDATRALVIDGVAPPAIKLPLNVNRDASEAFSRVIGLCREDADCAAAFPQLESHYREVLERLQTPREVSLRDPAGGERVELELNRDLFTPLLRLALYSREYTRLLPLIIEEAWRGNYEALAAMDPVQEGVNQAMFLSVICNEDFSLIGEEELQREMQADYLLESELMLRPIVEACALWPKRDIDPDWFEPAAADAPALILSGAFDPVTPPRWGELTAQTLPNSRHLVAEGVGHGVTPYGCAPRLIAEFIDDPEPEALDASCLETLKPRPFFLNYGGSAPAPAGGSAADDD